MDISVSCGGLPLCFPGRAVRKFPRWASPPQLAVLRTVAICTRASFLSISITCCYYLLVFCFPAAMWNSVSITSRVAMWSLVDVCFDNSRFWYSVSEAKRIPEARVVDDRDFVYIVRFAGRDKSSVRDSRDWLVVLRWRVGKVATGGHPRDRGGTVCRYRRVGRLARFGQGRGAFGTRP